MKSGWRLRNVDGGMNEGVMTTEDVGRLRDDLKRAEGLRLKPYRDPVGELTIGWGRNLADRGISQDEAAVLLDHDIQRAMSDVLRNFRWASNMDAARQSVLVEMAFNMGITRLLGFVHTLKACEEGRYQDAAIEMMDSKWATQVGARATRLADRMHSGEWK